MSDILYMPHAGHFICGHACRFRLNTYVNGFIVSTVGEMANSAVFDTRNGTLRTRRDSDPVEPLGADKDSLYETMVFRAVKSGMKCCPWVQESGQDLESKRYSTADAATAGHSKLVAKYARRKP